MMNPKKIAPFFWVFFLFLLQNSVGFIFPQKAPLLVFCGVLFYAFSEGAWFGAILGAFAGVLLEVFGGGRFGGEVAVFAASGFIFGRATRTFFRESVFTQFLMPVLALCFYLGARGLLFYISMGEARDAGIFQQCWQPRQLIGVAILAPALFFFLKKVSDGVSKG